MTTLPNLSGVSPNDAWFILRVRPNYEDIAREFLEKQLRGCDVYYPCGTVRKRKVEGPRVKVPTETERRAVFQGYVYAQFREQWPEWARLDMYCSAQPRLLLRISADGENYKPIYVKNKDVNALRTAEAAGKWDEAEPKNPILDHILGQKIPIPTGTFKGKTGKVLSIDGDIVTLSVRMLGSKAKIAMNLHDFYVFA